MKCTGIVRKIDELGRLVLPKELRTSKDIKVGDPMEIFIDGPDIILKKYEPACIFCGDARDVTNYREKKICQSCLDELRR